MKQSQWIGA